MGKRNYKVGDEIKVVYQAPGRESGATVTMTIYDEAGALDPINFPDVVMSEVASTGRYRGSFTPDNEGEWEVSISLPGEVGSIIKQYSVGGYSLDGIGDIVTGISTDVDAVAVPPMVG